MKIISLQNACKLAVLLFALFASNSGIMAQSEQEWLQTERLAMPAPAFALTQKQLLGLGIADELRLSSRKTDELGMVHYRYQQWHNGYAVEAAQLLLHEQEDITLLANGGLVLNISAPATAQLSESTALQRALSHVGGTRYAWQDETHEQLQKELLNDPQATLYPKGTLVWVSPNFDRDGSAYRLAYKFDVYAIEPLKRVWLYIDAQTGEVISEINRLHDADVAATGNDAYSCTNPVNITADHTGSFYRLRETQRGGGIQTYTAMNSTSYPQIDITDTDTHFNNDPTAVSAHRCTEATYDYYKNTYNRNSIDGNGFPLRSWVHSGNNLDNAFWDGNVMTYGDGGSVFTALTSPDVVAHEITHGLTQFEAGLVYSYQPGALNESFSDIFGTVIEHYANPTCADWIIGGDITVSANGLRSMSNPNDAAMLTRGPDTYGGQFWYTGSNDHGGVHINSGVQNFWFYLLVNGGTGTNDIGYTYNVSGIGMTKAAAIAYRNLTTYLTSTSDYTAARAGSIQAASDLYGASSNEVAQVTAAWCAVGVGSCSATPNTLTLTLPNGGEVWQQASSHVLTWTSTGSIANVNLEYSIDGGLYWNSIAANIPNTGNYAWVVPNVTTTTAKARVSSASQPTINDESNAHFTILGCDVVAGFSTPTGAICTATPQTFSNASSGTGNLTYTWKINGNTVGTSTDLSYNFTSSGTYSVSLVVSNGAAGCSDTYTQTVTVSEDMHFTTTVDNLSVNFYAPTVGATQYLWHFGDGSTGTGINVSHTYNSPGAYNVILTTVGTNGCLGGINSYVTETFSVCRDDLDNDNSDGDNNINTGTNNPQNQRPRTIDAYNYYNQSSTFAAWELCDDNPMTTNKREGIYSIIENSVTLPTGAIIDDIVFHYNYISTTGTGSGGDHDGWGIYFNELPYCANAGATYPTNAILDTNGNPIGYADGQNPNGDFCFPANFPSDAFLDVSPGADHINLVQSMIDTSTSPVIHIKYYYAINSNSEYWNSCFNVDFQYHFYPSDFQMITITEPCTPLPTINWQTCLGTTSGEWGKDIVSTIDNGFISISEKGWPDDFWIVKHNSSGSIDWQQTLGGTGQDIGDAIIQNTDGSYMVVGSTSSNNGNVSGNHGSWDGWVAKLSNTGSIVWQKCLGGTSYDELHGIIPTNDNGYLVAGYTGSNNGDVSGNHGGGDGWIVKLNSLGNIVWQKCYGGAGYEQLFNLSPTSDGNYLAVGINTGNGGDVSDSHGGQDIWVIKFDALGNLIWQRSIGGLNDEFSLSIKELSDGNYVAVGATASNDSYIIGNHGGADGLAVKLSSSGTILWQKCLGGTMGNIASYPEYDESIIDVVPSANGSCFVIGNMESNDGDVSGNHGEQDIWLAKLDSNGSIEWQKCFGGTGWDRVSAMCSTNGTDLKFIGTTYSNNYDVSGNHGVSDVWIVNVSIDDFVMASFDIPTVITCDAPLIFNNNSTNATSYEWYINGNLVNTTENLTYIFSDNGSYDVFLKASNATCTGTMLQTIQVNSCPLIVWPGDFNYDGVTNNYDLLHWGWAAGAGGAARPNASFAWQGQPCTDWAGIQQDGINYKHADGNGNGVIDNADPQAIIANYGRTHTTVQPTSNTGSPFTLVPVLAQMPPSIGSNTTLYIDLYLNNDGNATTTLYGSAFKVHYYFPNALAVHSAYLDFSDTWVGTNGVNLRNVQRHFPDANGISGTIEVAFSRNDHQNATGSSKIVTLVTEIDLVNTGDGVPIAIQTSDGIISVANGNLLPIAGAMPTNLLADIGATPTGLVVQPQVWLGGAFNAANGNMTTQLRTAGIIPLQNPYTVEPWRYAGNEAVSALNDMPTNVTDWVLVEMRAADNPGAIVARKAALLLNNGNIVDADGPTQGVRFPTLAEGEYYVAVRHRNHIDLVSSNPVVVQNNTPAAIDLRQSANVMGGASQMTALPNGQYALKAGDFDANGVINVSDYNGYAASPLLINAYQMSDADLNGQKTIDDFNLYRPNAAAVGLPYIRY